MLHGSKGSPIRLPVLTWAGRNAECVMTGRRGAEEIT